MMATLVTGIVALVIVAAAFLALWILDARRADNVSSDPERIQPRRSWRRTRRAQATHRARPHP